LSVTSPPADESPALRAGRLESRVAETADIPRIAAFLEARIDTSLFLLANLRDLGITFTSSPLSGNFVLLEEDGALAAVFCLTRKGDLLIQAGGRGDLAAHVLADCRRGPHPVTGLLSEWDTADALWRRIVAQPGFVPAYESKNVVYRLDGLPPPHAVHGVACRPLTLDDFQSWEVLDRAFHQSEGLEVVPSTERRREGFHARVLEDGWWGAFSGAALLSIACLNADYGGLGQIGGVFTRPEDRRRGLARLLMYELTRHHHSTRGLRGVVLFAAEQNQPARTLYESMGFVDRGRFGLLFGVQA
jgi:predicted GNAT family acetyltransferase